MILVETERLLVRTWNPEADAPQAFEFYGDLRVMRWLGAVPKAFESEEHVRARLVQHVERFQGRPHDGLFPVVRKSDAKVIGGVIFREMPDADGAGTGDYEVGWHFAVEAWGQGFATEAARGILAWGAEKNPTLTEVWAIAYPENVKSLAVMQRLGMTPVGMTTKYYGIEAMSYRLDLPLKNQ